MTELKKQIENFIVAHREKARPLSAKSLTAYASTLLNLYSQIFGNAGGFDFTKFNDYKTILNYLNSTPYSTRKTKLATVLNIATDKKAIQEYKKTMNADAEKYNKEQSKNEATQAQKDVNLTQEEIHQKGAELKNIFDSEILALTDKKAPKPYGAYQKISLLKHIIYMLTSGEYIPPRRLMDWAELKIGKIDKRSKKHETEKHNIYDPKTGIFVMNVYKTADTMGTQYIQATEEMQKDINKYIKLTKLTNGDYLISDKSGEPLTITNFNKRLGAIYGKNRSVNCLRHSYITEKYKSIPTIEALTKTADAMGHGVRQHLEYIKR